jgi:hypothetical protein
VGVHSAGQSDYGVAAKDAFFARDASIISDCIEMWDYVGGVRFRGFVAEQGGEKAMFVFFDQAVVGGDLKAGYVAMHRPILLRQPLTWYRLMALLELCEVDYFACDRLVVCIDRHADATARDALAKDLGWIGFSLTTLDEYSETGELTSDTWLFMEMDT